jgi:hypothetical protein
MDTQKHFAEPQVSASVSLTNEGSELMMDPNGYLVVREDRPTEFHLTLFLPEQHRCFVAQKNVSRKRGAYHAHNKQFSAGQDCVGFQMENPITVRREGQNVWTEWHVGQPNRTDIWEVKPDGTCTLFQVGVFTHDDGESWKLLGEYRWRGRLFDNGQRIVGKPEHKKWGAFDVRKNILNQPAFMKLVNSANLEPWQGTDDELNPSLPNVPEPRYAVVQWYITFAGQTGQGPARLHESDRWSKTDKGLAGWICGVDILGVQPDSDGEIRLWQGDIVSYDRLEKLGTKRDGEPKLTNVHLVHRAW